MADKVFVSPGVYTSEKDLTFVTRQVGVTTLGLVGETTQGPAFQPIFISDYGEFQSFFGGLNNTLVNGPDGNGAPQYELPYIAKSYLSQSNQLFVTRVLGFSGYHAGPSWGITLDASLDESTITGTTTSSNPIMAFTASTGGTLVSVAINDAILNQAYISSSVNLNFLATANTGITYTVSTPYTKLPNNTFTGATFGLIVTSTSATTGNTIVGSVSGYTNYQVATGYADVENKLVALLRSRGTVSVTNQITNYQVAYSSLTFDTSVTGATTNPLGTFSLSGYSITQGNFDYSCSFDATQKNYIGTALGFGTQDKKTAIFIEELYASMFEKYGPSGLNQIKGIKLNLINYSNNNTDIFGNYLQSYQPAVTPYIVSELRGNKLLRLFRFWTISDGNAANEQIKISIANIRPDTMEFDVQIRSFYDLDSSPVVLEAYSRCVLDPTSSAFIGRKIGTVDGVYQSNSSYVLVELDTNSDTSDAFPAGFVGYPVRDYTLNGNSSVQTPDITYKDTYGAYENKRKSYLGLSDTVGIDTNFLDYKGLPDGQTYNMWTGLTNGFHMDINASAATIDDVKIFINSADTYYPIFLFDTGDSSFLSEADAQNGSYAQLYSRKFTLAPAGGFDGWDIYRTRRTNLDNYVIGKSYATAGLASGAFLPYVIPSTGDLGNTSDYYAYLEGILSFANPEEVNINVFATPGIDVVSNDILVQAAIDMVEQNRADSLYIITSPDTDSGAAMQASEAVDNISDAFDSNYSATYWPWIQILDAENNIYIFVPPTRDVVRNIALTDNISFPWFAVAGIQRGDVDCIKARVKLTQADRDLLYENRINPVTTFSAEGVKIWGNKTLQVANTALNRINVRRLLLQARKLISAVSIRLLFEQDDTIVRNQFTSLVNPILDNIRSERGLTDFRVVVSTSPEDLDNHQLTGTIFLKPTNALEYIELEFDIMDNGASFANI